MQMTNGNLLTVQRAIVLQGGGALGAYDAGVLRALIEKIQHQIDGDRSKKKNRNIFDILAGTSSGAINASIVSGIVTHRLKEAKSEGKEPDYEKIWGDAIDRLYEFWRHLAVESEAERDPFFDQRWKTYRKFNESAASPEAARRWYSTRQFLQYGAKNVFKASANIPDNKYFDFFNTWYRYDNSPLRESLKECNCFPLASQYADGHPRLLMVSVDVMDGVPVTFDSYEKAPGSRFSEYGESGSQHIIQYDSGITEYHVMASASVPVNYDYVQLQDSANNNNTPRYFWDGGWFSNTPLRELISEHRAFWIKEIQDSALESDIWKEKNKGVKKIPDLRVYITNVWPKEVVSIPQDHDRVVERSRDMFFMDKTEYDEKVASLVNDYINLVKELQKRGYDNAANKGAFNEAVRQLMNDYAASFETSQKLNKDLIKGKFDVRVHRIQLSDDEDSTSRKFFDYSRGTIENLMDKGYHDGQSQFKDIIN